MAVAPSVDLASTHDSEVVVESGRDLDLVVNFTGYPAPNVTLILNNEPIKNRATVEEYDDSVSVRIKAIKRKDSGTLKVL